MTDSQIVYKRNSVWWIATCYLLGTLFLLLAAVGGIVNAGIGGVKTLIEMSGEQEAQRYLAGTVSDQVQVSGFRVNTGQSVPILSAAIDNNSPYTISKIHLEVSLVDDAGIAIASETKWLSDLGSIFPGDRGQVQFPLSEQMAGKLGEYQLRIASFSILDNASLQAMCEQVPDS
ncbi:hypothetical protein CHH28_09210 [Bacterioplanes sanyensis]|uniref:Uncharacterized protein n=1 Tax=Bacterioplanes sanyensis TaxID=1249553 RepID=A0A222FIN1_9GAMM|nr:hypothetical protein [Bacterioplanes sanyensis]ASP38848.1 hypothetical protein CHH28_09210 [Bacterioplanes sanyensis]